MSKIRTLYYLLVGLMNTVTVEAAIVTKLQANYRDGQVFLAWQNPNLTNQLYKVYRSTVAFTSADQLNSANYIGEVRDSSSKNLRRSRIEQKAIFYRWQAQSEPLPSHIGLYVVTCTENGHFYYAVTVTDLATGVEDKTLLPSKNTLSNPVSEFVAFPQPVWQDSVIWGSDVAHMYVQFGDNRQSLYQRTFNGQGSYGYNFFLIRRGQTERYPLYVFLEGIRQNALVGNGLDEFANITNCYIMGLDDWIPYPDGYGTDAGKTTSWVGYHEHYDMYSANNPTPSSGRVVIYTQHRIIHSIEWARKYLPIDTNRIYLVGVSTGGFGALITANLIPEKIAGMYVVAHPSALQSGDGWHTQLWGLASTNLKTNVPDFKVRTDTIRIMNLMNISYLFGRNVHRALPPIYGVYGKNDNTVGWKDKPAFFDSAQAYGVPAVFYWDQRQHDGTNANFLDSETMPPFASMASNLTYPVFTKNSSNGTPGNGKKNNGDAYGTINGLMHWQMLEETKCSLRMHLSLKDYYVGGQLASNQPESCTTDITFKRLQTFKPQPGKAISWYHYDAAGTLIQSGTYTPQSGTPVTLSGISVNKSGNTLVLKFGNCLSRLEPEQYQPLTATWFPTPTGWKGHVYAPQESKAELRLMNVMGQEVERRRLHLSEGENILSIDVDHGQLWFVELRMADSKTSWKLLY